MAIPRIALFVTLVSIALNCASQADLERHLTQAQLPVAKPLPVSPSISKVHPTDIVILPYHHYVDFAGGMASSIRGVRFFVRNLTTTRPRAITFSPTRPNDPMSYDPISRNLRRRLDELHAGPLQQTGNAEGDPAGLPQYSLTDCLSGTTPTGPTVSGARNLTRVTVQQTGASGCDYKKSFVMAVYTSGGSYLARASVAIDDDGVTVNSVTTNVEECKSGTLAITGENLQLISAASIHDARGRPVTGVQVSNAFGFATSRNFNVSAPCWSAGTHNVVLKADGTLYARVYSPEVYTGVARIAAATSCGAGESLECSAPYLLQGLSTSTLVFANVFKPACRIHDFCYRHGQPTYNHSKTKCDDDFKGDLDSICQDPLMIAAAVATGGATAGACFTEAQLFTSAVRNFGTSAYRTSTSDPAATFCRYSRRMN